MAIAVERMADRNPQISITLSEKVVGDYDTVAGYLQVARAALIADVVNNYHRSPTFSSLLKRADDQRAMPEDLRQKIRTAIEKGDTDEALRLLDE